MFMCLTYFIIAINRQTKITEWGWGNSRIGSNIIEVGAELYLHTYMAICIDLCRVWQSKDNFPAILIICHSSSSFERSSFTVFTPVSYYYSIHKLSRCVRRFKRSQLGGNRCSGLPDRRE